MGYNFFAAKKRCTILQSVEIPCGVCTILCVESKRFVANAREVNVVVKDGRMLCFLLFLPVKNRKKLQENLDIQYRFGYNNSTDKRTFLYSARNLNDTYELRRNRV